VLSTIELAKGSIIGDCIVRSLSDKAERGVLVNDVVDVTVLTSYATTSTRVVTSY